MRKTLALQRILIIVSQLLAFNLFAQPTMVNIPVKAKQLFTQMHPKAENVRWSSGYYLILAEFNTIDADARSYLPEDGDCTVEFYTANMQGKEGKWWRTMKHYYTMEEISKQVPAAVLKNIKKEIVKMESTECLIIGLTVLSSDNDCFELCNSGKPVHTKGYFVDYKRADTKEERHDVSFTAKGTPLYSLP